MELTSRPGLLGIDVATWSWRRDMAWSSRRSRPGLLNLGSRHHFEVATWFVQFGVATWTLFRSLFGYCSS